MSYFDGIFLVNDVYQYRLREAWPVDGYGDSIPTQIDPLFNLTKFATTGNFSTQLNQKGVGLTVLYPFNRDASTNNFDITVVGDAKAANFSPYTPGYYSAYFDGTGDSLSVPGNSVFAFDTGDFTLEVWLYANSISTGTFDRICATSDYTGSGFDWTLNTSTSSLFLAGTSFGIGSITTGQWHHLVYTRSGSNIRGFLNGNLSSYATGATQNISSTAQLNIGVGYSGTYLNGYLSNLRIIKGSIPSAYQTSSTTTGTQIFTSPASPLTAITNTSLLACQSNRFIDNSTNNFTITKNGDTSIAATNPFTPNNSYSTYGSGYFDGSGDYLTPTSSSAYAFGTGDFTVECWIYVPSVPGGEVGFVSTFNTGSGQGFILGTGGGGNAGRLHIGLGNGTGSGNFDLYDSVSVIANTWIHVAAVRNSGTVTLYKSGVSVGSGSGTNNIERTLIGIGISYPNSPQGYVTGYIADVRVVNGTAVYTSAFTPPTLPLTAVTNTSLLTLQTSQPHNNHTFLDRSNNKFLITRAGNATQGTFSPYNGSWSNYFDGTGDYLTTPSSLAMALGSTFTVECWIYVLSWNNSGPTILDVRDSNIVGVIYVANDGTARMQTTATSTIASQTGITLNTWIHVAYVSDATSSRIYVNGSNAGATNQGQALFPTTAKAGFIGADFSGGYGFNGYISNMRVVKGTAVYTSNFTPPTAPLTITSGSSLLTSNSTSLLTCQSNRFIDISTNNFTITGNGGVAVSSESPFSKAYTHPVPTSYSGYFDGTGDYLVSPASSALALATNAADFTIECWVYNNGGAGSQYGRGICVYYPSGGYGTNRLMFRLIAGGDRINVYLLANSSAELGSPGTDGTATVTIGAWTHVALVRNAGVFYVYVNGVLDITVSSSSAASSIPFTTFNTIEVGRTQDGSSPDWNGYISNYRFIKGTAVYTSNFTPPTAPLTAITNTSLLTCQSPTFIDNSTNAFAITVNGNAKPTTVNPFGSSQTLTDYTPDVYGGSAYFDGNDYLTVPDSTAFTMGADNFTCEAWVYLNNLTGSQTIFGTLDAGGNIGVMSIFLNVLDGTPRMGVGYGGTVYYAYASATIPANSWVHLAGVRNGAYVYIYVNGVQAPSPLYMAALAITDSNQVVGIGRNGAYNGEYLNGYISDARIVKGTALYTSTFVPPVAPSTPNANNSLMLNFTDAAVKDYTMRSNMESMADLKVSSVNSKFGGTSLYFDGTGDYGNISPVSNTLILGTGDFTAEMWINPYSNITTTYPMTIGSEAAGRYNIFLVNGTLQVNLYGGATANLTFNGPRIPANIWSHIAVVRAAGNVRGYYNGNVLPNTQVNSSIIGNGPLRLGSDGTGSANFFGYMDDVRITANARYTANFIPAITYLPTR